MKNKKNRRHFGKSRAAIAVHIAAILLTSAIYLVGEFVYKKPQTENLWRYAAVLGTLAASLSGLLAKAKSDAAYMEKVYADKIGHAFEDNKKSKKLLINALIDYNNNNYSRCIKKLTKLKEKASTLQEKQTALYFAALCLKEQGNTDAAVKLYNEILEFNPLYAPALSNLSVIYYEAGNYGKSAELAERALDYNRQNPFANINLAVSYFRTYNIKKAKEYALRALELKKDLYPASSLLAAIYSIEGNVLAAKKYTDMALASGQDRKILEETIRIYKNDYARKDAATARNEERKGKAL